MSPSVAPIVAPCKALMLLSIALSPVRDRSLGTFVRRHLAASSLSRRDRGYRLTLNLVRAVQLPQWTLVYPRCSTDRRKPVDSYERHRIRLSLGFPRKRVRPIRPDAAPCTWRGPSPADRAPGAVTRPRGETGGSRARPTAIAVRVRARWFGAASRARQPLPPPELHVIRFRRIVDQGPLHGLDAGD